MVLSFIRKLNMSPGIPDSGDVIYAEDVNELQAALEGLSADTIEAQADILALETATANARTGIYNVLDYPGVDPTGLTDSTAGILLAVNAAKAAGGGTIYFPSGRYLIATRTSGGGSAWFLPITSDNISFVGQGRSTVLAFDAPSDSPHTGLFFIGGAGKTAGISAWATNDYADGTLYDMDPAGKSDTSITLSTPADADNFSVGDWVHIRTGQTIDGGTRQPDSELNQVTSADSDTGVIELRWPLAKPYVAEAIDTGGGHANQTITGGAGDPSPLGVINVTDRTIENIHFRDFRIEYDRSNAGAFIGGQAYNVTFERVTADIACSFTSNGHMRHVRFADCHQNHTAEAENYFIAPSTGCTDWAVDRCSAESLGLVFFHIHEGVAQYSITNSRIVNRGLTGDKNVVSVRARAYDIAILNNYFEHAATSTAVYVDPTCDGGGMLSGNVIEAGGSPGAISIAGANWTVLHNTVPVGDFNIYTPTSYMPVMRLAGWVRYDDQQITLGDIPAAFAVLRVHCRVNQAFNSDGTDLIEVGYSSDPDAYATAIDVSTTGIKSVSAGTKVLWEDNTRKTILATYTNGGSEPTQGRALVIVEYAFVQWRT